MTRVIFLFLKSNPYYLNFNWMNFLGKFQAKIFNFDNFSSY